MEKNDIKKDLYKSKAMAKFSHYVSGNLYYTVQLEDGVYQFPIPTIETYDRGGLKCECERVITVLSEDLATTSFPSEIRGSELNRWITKAVDKEEFIKVG